MTQREEFAAHWPVVLAAFVGVLTGVWAFPFQILGPLVKSFETEFGWSRTAIVGCATALAAGLVIGTPIAGRLVDRVGPRAVAMVSMVALILCMAAFSMIGGAIWQLHGLYFLMGLLGAGSGGVAYTRAVGAVFTEGRGLALGIVLSATGAAGFLAPNLVELLSERAGWRSACLILAGMTLCVGLPTIFFGLGRAGAGPRLPAAATGAQEVPADGATPGQAMRDYRFWVLILATVLLGLFVGSLLIHAVPMLIDKGLTPARAAQIASVNGIAMILGRVLAGPLVDRFAASHVGAGIFLLGACGAVLFVAMGTSASLFMIASIGLLVGAQMNLMSFMVLKYFGLRNYGTLFGIVAGVYSAAGMATPFVSGGLLLIGGYDALYLGAGGAFMVAAVAFLALSLIRSIHARRTI